MLPIGEILNWEKLNVPVDEFPVRSKASKVQPLIFTDAGGVPVDSGQWEGCFEYREEREGRGGIAEHEDCLGMVLLEGRRTVGLDMRSRTVK